MEKSIGTILGELYRKAIEESERQEELRLGRQEALKAALSIFLKDFQPATPEERIAKAIALENIKNKKLYRYSIFSDGSIVDEYSAAVLGDQPVGSIGYGYKYDFERALEDGIIIPPHPTNPGVFELKNPNQNIKGVVR